MALGETFDSVSTEMDPEHGRWEMIFRTRKNNQVQTTCIDRDILKLPKFSETRALLGQIAILGEPPYQVGSEEGEGGAQEKVLETVDSLSALIDYVISAGKRGFAIQRYKGLGEMNPEQLWETTLDPNARVMLQVRLDDAVQTDQIFTVLMGDQVEPRRQFIENNALNVKNLDI
jgi:DNA gyrase subunit B